MAPPRAIKLKSHKSIPRLQPVATTSSSTNQDPNNDQQLKFEEELHWCQFKLQKNLETANSPKQIEDIKHSLKILKSTTQPIVKKRQLMRQLFGDYRTKMGQETPQELGGSSFAIKSSQPHKSSFFVKKMAIVNETDKNFKFNFDVAKMEALNLDSNGTSEKPVNGNVTLAPSNQEFKFNFNIE